jgi:hypothetical protein
MKTSDLIDHALLEIGVLAAGEISDSASDSDVANFCLGKLNRLLDNFNAEETFIFGTTLFQGTLTANKNPHTLGATGAGGDFSVATARPPKILGANLVLTDVTPNIFRPLKIVDDMWWMNNPVPSLATQIPYYLWPNYGWPLSQLYLWPVPTTAYDIRLDIWTLFSSLTLASTFTLPPGYEDAVTLSLAESLAPSFGKEPSPLMLKAAADARTRVQSLNSEAPTMTSDGAIQSMDSRPRASIANFLSGFFN